MTAAAPAAETSARLAAERLADLGRVEQLIDAAFGPGRFAKTAERLREGNAPRLDLSVCAWAGGRLVGAVRMWPIAIGATPAVFLGPIAVAPEWRRHGVGAQLVNAACEAAAATGESTVLLVGDAPFFGPLGFARAPAEVRLPGPVDPARVLWRALGSGASESATGLVSALPPGAARA